MSDTFDTEQQNGSEIAIIGMALRFPGAGDIDSFWRLLCESREAISFFSAEELQDAGVPQRALDAPHYVRAAPILEDIDCFDAAFFGCTPLEAKLMDPQQRLMLECAWEALEHAGYDAERFPGSIGVYVGARSNTYLIFNILTNSDAVQAPGSAIALANDVGLLSTRISYKMNLKGPSYNVQTACSTGLVAVHLACQSLLIDECQMALAGAVAINVPHKAGYYYEPSNIMSPDGHCRPFDSDAQGTNFGSGVGVVVLKRLSDALRDQDMIYAVIKGSATNNDGTLKASFTAPSVEGQMRVISEALACAEVHPETIGYVEAHGTGTALGDPIEVAALTKSFRAETDRRGFCALGSVKSNLGHLDAAAGMAGLIKAVLAVHHGFIPPTLHLHQPHPDLHLATSPFYLPTSLMPWPESHTPRRAGVSAFGIGGTNAHVILEQAPPRPPAPPRPAAQLLLLSAKSPVALDAATARLRQVLDTPAPPPLAAVASTLQLGRQAFAYRRVVRATDPADAAAALSDPARAWSAHVTHRQPLCAFLFPGEGTQYQGMGWELYQHEPLFRETVDRCAELLRPHLGLDIRAVIYPDHRPPTADHRPPAAEDRGLKIEDSLSETSASLSSILYPLSSELDRTEYAQPALFVVEYALARLWRHWGVEPSALVGQGVGEYVAACLAEVLTLEQALRLVVARGRAAQRLRPAAMPALAGAEQASHAPQLAELAAPLRAQLEREQLLPPRIPYVSNVTGTWITAAQATDPAYWVEQLCAPEQFAAGLATLGAQGPAVLLEVGPGETLGRMARQHSATRDLVTLASLPGNEAADERAGLDAALAQLWLAGLTIDWAAVQGAVQPRLALPTYPFERQRYWMSPGRQRMTAPDETVVTQPAGAGDRPSTTAETNTNGVARDQQQQEAHAPLDRERITEIVRAAWQELLGVEQVRPDSQFWDLGGDSLIATQLFSRLRAAFRVELSLRNLFDMPTLQQLVEHIERLLQDATETQASALRPVSRKDRLPLSFAQQRLWFLNEFEPGSPYHIFAALRCEGTLNISGLTASLNEVVQRHESLRTTFAATDGQPVQIITPSVELVPTIIDLRPLPMDQRPAEALHRAMHEVEQPFDLARPPLMRVTLLQISDTEHLLVLTMHHIISDGWSIGVLIREIAAYYAEYVLGRSAELPALPIQYADFAHWQRRWLTGEVIAAQLSYWRGQLQDAQHILELPADYPRPTIQTFRGATRSLVLPSDASMQLKTFSQEAGVTLFMTLFAAFLVLLHRYTGQSDISVGTPVANRNRLEIEALIGFFVNTLVLRTDVSGDPSFRELLGRVRDVALGAYAHQDLPFEKLVEELVLERDMSHNPLFQVMFALQNTPIPAFSFPDLRLSPVQVENKTAKFDLSLDCMETPAGLLVFLEYNTDLFRDATIDRMLGHFQALLVHSLRSPDHHLSELSLLTGAERDQLLYQWNDTDVADTAAQPVHLWFEFQAARAPDAVAVIQPAFGDSGSRSVQCTYDRLNGRANRIAHYLRHLGILPGARIGIFMERSAETIAAVLGVLKAGCAYVPVDAAYSKERLAFVMQDAQTACLITQARWLTDLPPQSAPVICLDRDCEAIERESGTNPPAAGALESLAYIIYTSGSTGRPKGAMISHGSLANAYAAWEHAYALSHTSRRHLQMASFSFDVFSGDWVRALCSGGTLVLCARDYLLDPAHLYELMRREQIDSAEFVPSVLRNVLLYLERTRQTLDFMRLLVVGSDSWYMGEIEHARRFCSPQTRLINSYGVSEATVDSAYFERTDVDVPAAQLVPIGRPMANMRLYALDQRLRPVPIGVHGELHIAGAGLAYGYLNNPALTAERFIPNPFLRMEDRGWRMEDHTPGAAHPPSSILHPPSSRLYKTGDLARYLPDGTIELLGRIDHQVKIRGFRIELGEIEARLGEHPAVHEAIVVDRADASGHKYLVAYIVPEQGQDVSAQELNALLKEQLPAYMAPSAFAFLSQLPLTSNGKIDRQALPACEQASTPRRYVAPTSDSEQTIAALWQELLQVEQVGIHDNFFERGGHSMVVPQLVFRLRDAFGIDIPLRVLFEAPTVAELARAIELLSASGEAPPGSVAQAVDLRAEVVLDPAIVPAAGQARSSAQPGAILLTGATGFLGAYLLRKLLENEQADIYCLVRAADPEQGRAAIRKNLESYSLWCDEHGARIIPVPGDLAKPYLGLSQQEFQMLAGQVDSIYHCGAWVNFIYPYEQLKPINVLGTQEILRLASEHKTKPVHLISTLSVFAEGMYDEDAVLREDDPLGYVEGLVGGYAQSKWVAEQLGVIARSRGVPVSIYRIGRISGDTQTGICHTRDLIWAMLKGCVQLKSAPDIDMLVDLAPVDYVSDAIIHLSRQSSLLGNTFHVYNPNSPSWLELVYWMQSYGYPLQLLPPGHWANLLTDVARHDSDNALNSFLPMFDAANSEDENITGTKNLRFSLQNTISGLSDAGITCPAIDDELIGKYIDDLIRTGFLNPPSFF